MTKCQALALHQLQINAHCKLLNKTLGDRIGHASLMLSAPISLRHSSIASNMAFAFATSKPRARRKRNNEWSSSRLRNSPCSVRTSRRLFRASCWDCVRSPGRLLIMSSSLVDEVPGDWLWEEVQWHRSWSMAQWQSSHVTTRKRCAASTDASFRILLLLQSILQILNPSKNILGCIMLKEDLLSDAFWRNRSTPVYREKTHTHTHRKHFCSKRTSPEKTLGIRFQAFTIPSPLDRSTNTNITSFHNTTKIPRRLSDRKLPLQQKLALSSLLLLSKSKHRRLSHIKASRLQQ